MVMNSLENCDKDTKKQYKTSDFNIIYDDECCVCRLPKTWV